MENDVKELSDGPSLGSRQADTKREAAEGLTRSHGSSHGSNHGSNHGWIRRNGVHFFAGFT